MIDFRYHLVSIISVFLALAVGIVLGAGPLQANIGSTLTDQVAALRIEKQDLHDQLDTSDKLVATADEFADAVSRRVVSGRLKDHSVAVVLLPSADGTLASQIDTMLRASGATVNATLAITPDWFDASQGADRDTAARGAASALGFSSSNTGDALLAEVLARILVTEESTTSSPSRDAALEVLVDAGLVDGGTPQLVPSDLVVMISGDFAGSEAVVHAHAQRVRDLGIDLAKGSRAAVVAGGAPVIAAGQPVSSNAVTAIREESDSADVLSTVDHARDGSGPATVVLALEAELDEHVGHYGISPGATASVPRVLQ